MAASDRNEQDGLRLAVDGVQGGNYLGDANLVNQLVRDFMTGVFGARAAFHESGDGDAAEARINHLCQQYGAIFMGESAAYVPQPWNSPHRLGNYLRAVVPPEVGTFASPGEAYLHFLAVQALNAAIALEQETMQEAEVQAGLTEVVDDAVDVLLGRKEGVHHAG